jgi:tetrahydromethanopterin S-methyltransferase subunit G
MNDFVTKNEFKQLATRVEVIEREVEGEKLVTRHVLEQTRRNGDDLAAIKTRLDRVEEKVDSVGQDVRNLKGTVDGLMSNLPKMVGEVVRSVWRERGGKR